MTWNTHITSLSKKLSQACFALKTLHATVNYEVLKTVYHALFESHLRYGIIFWGNATNSVDIFKLQKRAIRIMLNLPFRSPCRPHFKKIKILPLPCQYIFCILMFLHENPGSFNHNQHNHSHNTRTNSSKFYQYPIHRTTLLESGPYYNALKLHNSLPNNIKDAVNFSSSLKDYLLTNCFYTIEEFIISNKC